MILKNQGESLSKRLVEEVDKNKNWKSIFEDKMKSFQKN